jgi:hypothetical protein
LRFHAEALNHFSARAPSLHALSDFAISGQADRHRRINGNNLQASYSGGDGNDLTLTVVP